MIVDQGARRCGAPDRRAGRAVPRAAGGRAAPLVAGRGSLRSPFTSVFAASVMSLGPAPGCLAGDQLGDAVVDLLADAPAGTPGRGRAGTRWRLASVLATILWLGSLTRVLGVLG